MIEPITVDGIKYDKRYCEGLCEPLLDIRDCLIQQDQLPHAMSMSQVHLIMQDYIKRLKE